MTPTNLLLNADFASLSPACYPEAAIEDQFGIRHFGSGSNLINRRGAVTWDHTFEGYVDGTFVRIGTTLQGYGGIQQTGAVIEGYAKNEIGDVDWAALVPVNGTIATAEGPTFNASFSVQGFVLTATAAGLCYVEVPGPFLTVANLPIFYSVATRQGQGGTAGVIGFVVDGNPQAFNSPTSAWTWSNINDVTGAAPAQFRVGFGAVNPGDKFYFAFAQVEPYFHTSPIIKGTRAAETLAVVGNRVLDTGRLNIEWDLYPEVDFPGSTGTINLLFVDASNRVDLVWDATVLAYRMRVTIDGAPSQSDPFGWSRERRLRLFLSAGNGKAQLALKYEEEAALCLSGAFSVVQNAWPNANQLFYIMGAADPLVNQMSSMVLAIRCYVNGDRPDWVGCVCEG